MREKHRLGGENPQEPERREPRELGGGGVGEGTQGMEEGKNRGGSCLEGPGWGPAGVPHL